MSEIEIQRRKKYKQNRKRWMIVQLTAIILLAAIMLGSFFIYHKMNRTYSVEYTETGSITYMVKYRDNNFFDTDWIGMDQTYISSLIEEMTADFSYRLDTDSTDLGFNYQYRIDAKVLIASKDTGAPYYTYEENIYPPKESDAQSDSAVQLKESVRIDYVKYNQMAKSFIETYDLQNVASCTLIVTLSVDLLSADQKIAEGQNNKYTTSLNIPLAVDSINVYSTSSSPANEVKVLEYKNSANREIFFNTAVSALTLDVLLVLILIVFLHLTKNEDVTYEAKIRRILRSYRSFIQRIDGEFEYEGYQIVIIRSFTELLGIRDTIQSPVLMSENHDETMTRFLIPTSNRILYVFEIKVDNYDEIYGKLAQATEEIAPVAEEPMSEPEVEVAPVEETPKAEPEPVIQAPVVAETPVATENKPKKTRIVVRECCCPAQTVVVRKVRKKEEPKKTKCLLPHVLAAAAAVHVIKKITKR